MSDVPFGFFLLLQDISWTCYWDTVSSVNLVPCTFTIRRKGKRGEMSSSMQSGYLCLCGMFNVDWSGAGGLMKGWYGVRRQRLEKASRAMTACGTLAAEETGSVVVKALMTGKQNPGKLQRLGRTYWAKWRMVEKLDLWKREDPGNPQENSSSDRSKGKCGLHRCLFYSQLCQISFWKE